MLPFANPFELSTEPVEGGAFRSRLSLDLLLPVPIGMVCERRRGP
jgi:hypothetical protein